MPANHAPVFPLTAQISWVTLTTANTAMDGTGATAVLLDANLGVDVRFGGIRVMPLGTNAATVLRLFHNNGGDSSVAVNNSLFFEVEIPSAVTSDVSANEPVEVVINEQIPVGHKVLCTISKAVAAGIQVTAYAGGC